MKKVLIIAGILVGATGLFFLLRPKKEETGSAGPGFVPTGGGIIPPTATGQQDSTHGQGVPTPPPLPALRPGQMVYIAPTVTDAQELELFATPSLSQKVGGSRPSWTGIQPLGVFKGFSSDKKFAFITVTNWQVWGGVGKSSADLRKISGDYFVPVTSISAKQY